LTRPENSARATRVPLNSGDSRRMKAMNFFKGRAERTAGDAQRVVAAS
jgi:hypothetical protein